LEFAGRSFDAVISMAALEFMKDHSRALDEMFRVLKRGGNLLIGTINRLSPWGEFYLKAGKSSRSVFRPASFLTMEGLTSFRPDNLVSVSECRSSDRTLMRRILIRIRKTLWLNRERGASCARCGRNDHLPDLFSAYREQKLQG
jgi:SAM-dependent methyltransferase